LLNTLCTVSYSTVRGASFICRIIENLRVITIGNHLL